MVLTGAFFVCGSRLSLPHMLHYPVYLCVSLPMGDEREATCSSHHGGLLFRPGERYVQKTFYN